MPTLLYVAAHPDDDAFGVAGTIALHVDDPDLRFVLVHATDGEAGDIAPDTGVERADLGRVRRDETAASWDVIGRRPDRHEWLELPDGGVADHPFEDLVGRISRIMQEEHPDVVATFGPDGITGHPDHIAVCRATTEAFHRRADDGRRRLLYSAIPQSSIDRWNRKRREAGLWEWDPSQPFHLRGVPDDAIGVEVDTERVSGRVLDAVRTHRTQWSPSTMDDDIALLDSLRREYWIVAWPPTPAGARLRDVFAGL